MFLIQQYTYLIDELEVALTSQKQQQHYGKPADRKSHESGSQTPRIHRFNHIDPSFVLAT